MEKSEVNNAKYTWAYRHKYGCWYLLKRQTCYVHFPCLCCKQGSGFHQVSRFATLLLYYEWPPPPNNSLTTASRVIQKHTATDKLHLFLNRYSNISTLGLLFSLYLHVWSSFLPTDFNIMRVKQQGMRCCHWKTMCFFQTWKPLTQHYWKKTTRAK